MLTDRKDVVNLMARQIIWVVKHPIIALCAQLPYRGERIEHLQERWFDCPMAYVTPHRIKKAWKNK